MRPRVRIEIGGAGGLLLHARLRRLARRTLRLLDSRLTLLSVGVLPDAAMCRIHHQFLGDAITTDVVTFELEHAPGGQVTAGEILICIDEARRQARRRRIAVHREMTLYLVHGLLHLHGMEDRTPVGFKRMHEAEDRILSILGVGPVFSGGEFKKRIVAGRGRRD
jgi:probable rRNA maturation factor